MEEQLLSPIDEWEKVTFIKEDKIKELNEKIDTGEITCNMDDPESCENCGS